MAVRTLRADVAVIGAGPAGSVFATRMVQLGFDVLLVERSVFPRAHLGESLSPGVLPLLASVGMARGIEAARFPRVHRVSTRWEGGETERLDPRAQGMLADRGAFDARLLAHAGSVGVRVLQPAQVLALTESNGRWLLEVDAAGETVEVEARFVADASGRAARAGDARRAMGPRTIAIHGYWTGPQLPEQPRIEAGDREWFWGVPIPDGSYNTLVFVDGDRLRAEAGPSLDDRLVALLERSSLMRDAPGARLRGGAQAADATPYMAEDCIGEHRMKIGDAVLALDPLSSSGVQKAIQTALSGAIVANTMLRRPADTAAAQAFYRNSVTEAAERHQAWAAAHYATAAAARSDPFWTSRSATGSAASQPAADATSATIADDAPVQLSSALAWEELPCLGAQFVELRPALRHPRLDSPIAFVGGVALAPLLHDLRPGMTPRQLAESWSGTVPMPTGLSIAHWLTGHGVLEPCARADR